MYFEVANLRLGSVTSDCSQGSVAA